MKEIGRMIAKQDYQKPDGGYHSIEIDPQALAQVLKEASCQCDECRPHKSDCTVHNEPVFKKGECDCRKPVGLESLREALTKAGHLSNSQKEASAYLLLSRAVSTFLENNR